MNAFINFVDYAGVVISLIALVGALGCVAYVGGLEKHSIETMVANLAAACLGITPAYSTRTAVLVSIGSLIFSAVVGLWMCFWLQVIVQGLALLVNYKFSQFRKSALL